MGAPDVWGETLTDIVAALVAFVAPDFELPTVDGGRLHLAEHRGHRPVLIEFGSIT